MGSTMIRNRITLLIGMILMLFVFSPARFALSGDVNPVKPSPKDKCPVCGMFVAKYPDWVGEIIYEDGMTVFFDGAKDLFKYYFNIRKYHPEKNEKDIAIIYVTEYYNVTLIDAKSAYYVTGSDVYGPMGQELIPFFSEADALEFMTDHKGKRILRFRDIDTGVITSLD